MYALCRHIPLHDAGTHEHTLDLCRHVGNYSDIVCLFIPMVVSKQLKQILFPDFSWNSRENVVTLHRKTGKNAIAFCTK